MKTEKDLFIEITKHFKNAKECVSLYDCFFKTKDYDFKTLHCFRSGVFIKSPLHSSSVNRQDLKIYDLETKQYAEITKHKKGERKKMFKKTIKLLKSFDNLNFDIKAIDTEYGTDGFFAITITGIKTK